MLIDLDSLENNAIEQGFEVIRRARDILDVVLFERAMLTFKNFPEDNDNAFGFEQMPWHTHSVLLIDSADGPEYTEYSPSEVLSGLKTGLLVVVTSYQAGIPSNMWIDTMSGLQSIDLATIGDELKMQDRFGRRVSI